MSATRPARPGQVVAHVLRRPPLAVDEKTTPKTWTVMETPLGGIVGFAFALSLVP